jgi:hypothetical protein
MHYFDYNCHHTSKFVNTRLICALMVRVCDE